MTEPLTLDQWEPWKSLVAESNLELLRGRFDRVCDEVSKALVAELPEWRSRAWRRRAYCLPIQGEGRLGGGQPEGLR
jgi:hypothetical protein